jgi:hypothetical protein
MVGTVMKHEVNISSGITGDIPIDKPMERRAICIKLAIDTLSTHGLEFSTTEEVTDAVVQTAKAYQFYIVEGE